MTIGESRQHRKDEKLIRCTALVGLERLLRLVRVFGGVDMLTGKRSDVAATVLRALMAVGLLLSVVSAFAPTIRAADGTATVVITSLADDGTTPLPFARFQLIDSDGNILATQESAPPTG